MSGKLIDKLRPVATPEQAAMQRDVETALQTGVVIAEVVRVQVGTLAAICERQGLERLVGAMPEALQQPFRDALISTRLYWESQSSEPFPELSNQPTAMLETEGADAVRAG